MERILAYACLSIVISSLPGAGVRAGDDEPARHTEKAGKFSFVPPVTWTLREFPGLKYQVVVGPARSGFAPNINGLFGIGLWQDPIEELVLFDFKLIDPD